jgi:hypothetical protein
MGAAILMGTEKKSSDEPEEKGKKKRKKKGRFPAAIKLTAEFKEKLEGVADDLDLYPGELVEQKIGAFIDVEWIRILKKKLERAKKPGSPPG